MLSWQDTSLWENTDGAFVHICGDDWGMRLLFHKVENLAVTEEEHHTRLHHILEDEILVIVADLADIAHDKVIEGSLPSGSQLICLSIVVDLLLSHLGVEDFTVHASSKAGRNTALGVLDQKWLIVFGEKTLTD